MPAPCPPHSSFLPACLSLSQVGPTKPSCLSEGSLAVLIPNQSPHLPSTPVSHLLEKLRVPTAVFTADLKLSITQPASSVCPSILSPVEGAGLGATLSALFCLLQASIFLTAGSQTPPVLSCLASSSALTDVSGWMGPQPPSFLESLQPCPHCPTPSRWTQSQGKAPRASPWSSGRECGRFQAEGPHHQPSHPSPASWEQWQRISRLPAKLLL